MRSCHSRLGNWYSSQWLEIKKKKKLLEIDLCQICQIHLSSVLEEKHLFFPLSHSDPCRCVCVCSYVCVCNRIQQGGRDCSSARLLDGQQGDFHLDSVAKQLSIDLLMDINVGRVSSFKNN